MHTIYFLVTEDGAIPFLTEESANAAKAETTGSVLIRSLVTEHEYARLLHVLSLPSVSLA